jgi:translation initiation factor 1 (eIF-1/SUI1)
MKRALGCGASVEERDVLLQGALTERAAQWLRARGWSDVSIGN